MSADHRLRGYFTLGAGLVLGAILSNPALGSDPSSDARMLRRSKEAGLLFSLEGNRGDKTELRYRLVRSLGYFPTETWEVGGAIGLIGSFDELPSTLFVARVDRHFPRASGLLPYIGLSTGVRSAITSGDTATAPLAGLHAGIKTFVSAKVALTFELAGSFGGDGFGDRGLLLSIGVSQFFYPSPPQHPDGNDD